MNDFLDRITDKVEIVGECWAWMAYRNSDGYGVVKWQGRPQGAHRVMYQELVGDIPPGKEIDHLCGVRHCVNPDHMEPVDHLTNVRRGSRCTKTHCKHGHEYTPENTIWLPPGRGVNPRRNCRACLRSRNSAR